MIPRRFFAAIDIATLFVAFAVAYLSWPGVHRFLSARSLPPVFRPGGFGTLPPWPELSWLFVFFALFTVFFLALLNVYRPLLQQSLTRAVASSVLAPIAATGLVTAALFAFRRLAWSRLFVFSITVAAIWMLLLVRLSLRSYFVIRRNAGFYAKNVVLIGHPHVIAWLSVYFQENVSPAEYNLFGYLAIPLRPGSNAPDAVTDDIALTRLGHVDDLGDLLIQKPIHEVIAVQPPQDADWTAGVIETCDALGVLLRIVPEQLLLGKRKVLQTLYPFQRLHLPAVVLTPPHFDSDALFFKRLFDIVIAGLLLILLMPLFVLIAIAIKLDDPRNQIFYRWNVVGRSGKRFTGYKFTTMCADADLRKRELMSKNEMTGPVFKIKDDPRVTRVGRLLRKFSLNELPQLWSVLKGDMSLVGPRPAFPHELERYGFWHKRKLSIRPGITCLWQVRGRNKISDFDDWVKMDLEYIDNWSLWLDFKILVRTAWAVVAGTGS